MSQQRLDYEPLPSVAGDTKKKKRVQVSTIESYRRICESIGTRLKIVAVGLTEWIDDHEGNLPTAYELFEYLKAQDKAFDLNSVRPQLTNLKDLGLVEVPGKRICTITGEKVMVWRPAIHAGKYDAPIATHRPPATAPTPSLRKNPIVAANEAKESWNKNVPPNSRVQILNGAGDVISEAYTRGEAWIAGAGQCVVILSNGGTLDVRRLRPIFPEASLSTDQPE